MVEGIPFSSVNYDKTLHPQAEASLAEYVWGSGFPYCGYWAVPRGRI